MERKVHTRDLAYGMYVSRLDRSWLETPFLLQGLLIKNERDIELLREYCDYVYVETDPDSTLSGPAGESTLTRYRRSSKSAALPRAEAAYEDASSFEQEIEVARGAHEEVSRLAAEAMDQVRHGKQLDLEGMQSAAYKMKESVLRNPDAFLWLRHLKDTDSYTYQHSVDTSVLAVAFARHMGLPREDIDDLVLGALLFDIGKTRLPQELLIKPGPLTEDERALVKRHVEYSVQIMERTPGIPRQAVAVAATHHERFDGTGYPLGLQGGEIPVFGRMAAIVDFFDAVTSERCYAPAISSHEAVRQLYELRGTAFQEELVEQFIQMLGVYPTGTLVELTTGDVGVVISQNRVRRLRPKIMLLLDPHKKPYGIAPVVDLVKENTDSRGAPLGIERTLEPGEYGLDPKEFFL